MEQMNTYGVKFPAIYCWPFVKKTINLSVFQRQRAGEGIMRMLKILAGVLALVMLASCTAIDKVTSFVISIAEDAAPVINIDPEMSAPSLDNLSANEDSPFSLQLHVADDDLQYGDKLTFSAVQLPSWLYLTLDGVLEGTPENGDVGTHEVQVRVTDLSGESDELSLTIVVKNTNDAPIVLAGPLGFATQDMLYEQQLEYEDIDLIHGDKLSFSAVNLPEWLKLTPEGLLTGTPSNADVGVHELVVQAIDKGKLTAEQSYAIEVKNVNDSPSFITE